MGVWDYLLWLTGFLLNLGLLCVLLHKRRFQKFPWFTLLIAQDVHDLDGLNVVADHLLAGTGGLGVSSPGPEVDGPRLAR